MEIIRDDDNPEWKLAMDQEVQLADGSTLIPFIPHHVIHTKDEIVDYSVPGFAAIQTYNSIGRHLLSAACKYDLEMNWKQYDKIFIPYKHYKNGVRIEDIVRVWVVGLTRTEDGICNLVFKMLD